MMREWATVVDWQDGIATLICERQSSCNSCQANASCGMKVLAKTSSDQHARQIKMPLNQPVVIGQRIEIGIEGASLLKSALLLYGLPLLCLFIGMLFGYWLMAENEVLLIISAILGLAIGFFVARVYAFKMENDIRYHPKVLTIPTLSITNK